MKRRGFKPRVTRTVIATPARPDMADPAQHTGAAWPRARTDEWLSEEEMPDFNVDGTPMVSGIDLNGRPYGRTAEWEDDPWHVDTRYVYGSHASHRASTHRPRYRVVDRSRPRRSAPSLGRGAALRVRASRPPAGRDLRRHLAFQHFTEIHQVGTECAAPVAQLDHIDAAYAAFDIADEILRLVQLGGEIGLPDTTADARVAEQLAHPVVFDAMDGFGHDRRLRERSRTLYRRIVFPKIVYLARAMLGVFVASCAGEPGKGRQGLCIGTLVPGSCGTRYRHGWSGLASEAASSLA